MQLFADLGIVRVKAPQSRPRTGRMLLAKQSRRSTPWALHMSPMNHSKASLFMPDTPSEPVSSLSARMHTQVCSGSFDVEDGLQLGIGADAVVVAVGADEAAVKADVAHVEGGHGAELGGDEVLLRDAVAARSGCS